MPVLPYEPYAHIDEYYYLEQAMIHAMQARYSLVMTQVASGGIWLFWSYLGNTVIMAAYGYSGHIWAMASKGVSWAIPVILVRLMLLWAIMGYSGHIRLCSSCCNIA